MASLSTSCKSPATQIPLHLPGKPLCSKIGFSKFCFTAQRDPYWRLELNSRASNEGLPAELAEDSKFVPLNTDDPKYGPPALLLLGFQVHEATGIQNLLKALDGEFLRIIFCTEDMVSQTLWEAMNTQQSVLEASKVAASFPRICFLSGLSGEEMMMFIDAFAETGLEPPVFAAMVPNSADKTISELAEEIMGDHELMAASRATN